MIIAGPNGSGKSTLLDTIRTQYGGNIMYVPPHRAIRRQQVQQRYLLSGRISFEDIMMRLDLPSLEGLPLYFGNMRDARGYDDSANYLKHSLCQIEMERRDAITTRFDRDDHILRESIRDPWKPLKDLTHNLLPHLTFARIDTSDRDAVKCLWQVHGTETFVDFDDLSSGEKSIVQMFYPLVEHEINARLRDIQTGGQEETRSEICVMIDEPELHLHPNLQVKVLDYLRLLTTRDNIQVILATHSPTIVEYASFEELFLLRPIELVTLGENQLVQVADDEERLRFLRDVFGTTANLTAMQPIVIVEGIDETDAKKSVSDRKLYRALHPGFDGVTLISGGGKGESKALLRVLDEALKVFSSQLDAVALLDRDTTLRADDEKVHLLPVSMIENFLLDPDSIWEAIQSVIEKASLNTVDDVASALDSLLTEMEPVEVDRRVTDALGLAYFRPSPPVEDISLQAATFASEVQTRYSNEKVKAALEQANKKVEELRAQERRREEFHGKAVLNSFFQEHLHRTGLAKVIFTFEVARYARRRRAVTEYFDEFFQELSNPSDAEHGS
jgi:AAA domain, putative AbiEii toxin, Type IV TA system/AAA domain (dynein-related subfamily)